MTVIFDDVIELDDGMLLVEAGGFSEDDDGDPAPRFAGQAQGLLGAQLPGQMTAMVGLQSGSTRLRVELLESAPKLAEGYQDVVEASLTPEGDNSPAQVMALYMDEPITEIPLVIGQSYRVRWSGKDMDAGNDALMVLDGETPVDAYLLQLWPAPAAPDAVLQESSNVAKEAHLTWTQGITLEAFEEPLDVTLEAAAAVEIMRASITDVTDGLPTRLRRVGDRLPDLAPFFVAVEGARMDLRPAELQAFDTLLAFFTGQVDSLTTNEL